jgi:mono/diheme cytochrome c family protein
MSPFYRFLPALILTLPLVAAGDAAQGKEFYAKKCKACHAEDGSGAPAMKKKFGDKLKALDSKEVQGMTDAALAKEIKGVANHKALVAGLTDADLDNVIAFVRTFKK